MKDTFRNAQLTYAQIVEIQMRRRDGESVKDLSKEFGISRHPIYRWQRYDGLDAKWLRKVKELEYNLSLAKTKIREHEFNARIAANLIRQYEPSAPRRSIISTALCARYPMPRATANRIVGLKGLSGRASRPIRIANALLIKAIRDRLDNNPTASFNAVLKIFFNGRPGRRTNAMQLLATQVRKERRTAKPKLVRFRRPIPKQNSRDKVWSMDFMHHALRKGKRFYILTIIDDFSREVLCARVLKSRTSKSVIEELTELASRGRKPDMIRMDNAMEFKSALLKNYFRKAAIQSMHIRPYQPDDNALIERFNGSMRAELLNRFVFASFGGAQTGIDDWCLHYNYTRPHMSLKDMSPMMYVAAMNPEARPNI